MSEEERVDALLKEQIEMAEKRTQLLKELNGSYRIQRIFPDAFEHGRCKQTWRKAREFGVDRSLVLRVTRGDESIRQMLFEDLPEWFVDELIEEKGITGSRYLDLKKNGNNILTSKLSAAARRRKR
jgi:hypothetical protein